MFTEVDEDHLGGSGNCSSRSECSQWPELVASLTRTTTTTMMVATTSTLLSSTERIGREVQVQARILSFFPLEKRADRRPTSNPAMRMEIAATLTVGKCRSVKARRERELGLAWPLPPPPLPLLLPLPGEPHHSENGSRQNTSGG